MKTLRNITSIWAVERKPFIALIVAQVISLAGNILTMLAIPWFVLVTTGSASRAGITVAVGGAPIIIAGLFGGVIVDRLGYKRASIIADLASGLTVMMIPLLYSTIGLEFWQLLALVFLGALLDIPGETARRSLLPELAGAAKINLDRANTVNQMAYRVAGLAAPPLAGILIALVGASNLLWIDAATFAVSALVVARWVPSLATAQEETESKGARRYFGEVWEGIQFVRRDRVLFWFMIVSSVGSLLAEPLYGLVMPVYAEQVYGSAVSLGIMFAGLASGSIVGNILYMWLGPRVPRRAILVGGFAVRALTFWVLVALPPVWVVVISVFVNAMFLEPLNPLAMTIFQERVPSGMRGRVFGALIAVGAGTLPVGLLIYGFLLDAVGLRETLVLLAAVNLLVPITAFLAPALRSLPRPEPASSQLATSSD